MNSQKILIIVPAYNEEHSLPGVIDDLKRHISSADVVVVDDGSNDGTGAYCRGCGVTVLALPFNLGIGAAMQAGYRYAARQNYDIAVQFDADGQHLAVEIERLLEPIRKGVADIAVGSRFLEEGLYKAPIFRKAGIWIFSKILSRILGMRVTDSTSGFRASNKRVIDYFSRSYPEDYPEVEALVLLHKQKFRMLEVPVRMQERRSGVSSITPIRSVYYMIKVLLAIFIDLLKK